ncbi:MAG: hypothetical protein ACPG8N_09645 [Rhodothermales bacterium]
MKLGLTLIAAIAALGVWLFVQLAPYPAERRWEEFNRLPGVENVVEWNDMRHIRAEFSASPQGEITYQGREYLSTWTSFEDWKSDFDANDRNARTWYHRALHASDLQKVAAIASQQADQGSLDALRTLALMGIGQTSSGASVSDLLRQNGSATAELTMRQFVNRDLDPTSRHDMLLSARAMQENYRWENMSDAQYAKATASNQRFLSTLQRQAGAGDPDAKWVWGTLHGDTPVQIRIPD